MSMYYLGIYLPCQLTRDTAGLLQRRVNDRRRCCRIYVRFWFMLVYGREVEGSFEIVEETGW